MAKKFKFEPLQSGAARGGERTAGTATRAVSIRTIKVAAQLPEALHEHLMSHCFYDDERPTQEMVIIEALEQYLADKPNKPLPDHIKNRPRAGRKPKNS